MFTLLKSHPHSLYIKVNFVRSHPHEKFVRTKYRVPLNADLSFSAGKWINHAINLVSLCTSLYAPINVKPAGGEGGEAVHKAGI